MNRGLAVMRLQPPHQGHRLVIETMLNECDEAVVAIGSVQESRTAKNPLTFEERRMLLARLFPTSRLHIIGVSDIGAPTRAKWAHYVLDQVHENGLDAPTCYYGGSDADLSWFADIPGLALRKVDREGIGRGISATGIRQGIVAGDREALLEIPEPIRERVAQLLNGLKVNDADRQAL